MEEIKKNGELKQMFEYIQKALELYNNLQHEEKFKLVSQAEQKNVRDIFVCVYNINCVGLFKQINWSSKGRHDYNAGSLYFGIDSNYIGLKEIHENAVCKNEWKEVGTQIIVDDQCYVVNCNMQNAISFDDMRLIMYSAGQIQPYEIGKATSQEMLDVLKYAFSYYKLHQGVQIKKIKKKQINKKIC